MRFFPINIHDVTNMKTVAERQSMVVSILGCHAGDRETISRRGANYGAARSSRQHGRGDVTTSRLFPSGKG